MSATVASAVDHQARALLALIAGWDPRDRNLDLSNAMRAAREILAHPTAFDGSSTTPDIHEAVFAMLRAEGAGRESVVPLLDVIKSGDDLPQEIDSEDLSDLTFQAITYGVTLGAALMYQLLKAK